MAEAAVVKTVLMSCVAVICAAVFFGCGYNTEDVEKKAAEASARAAAEGKRIEAMERLADEGPPPATKEGVLRRIAGYGNVDDVRRLVYSGVDVNSKDESGNTALHFAASTGNAAVVRVLVDAGAKVDEKNDRLLTPLHMAVRHPVKEKHEAAYVLMAHGANVDAKSSQGLTPVDMAGWGTDKELLAYMKRISRRKPVTPEVAVELYANECASCHGMTGEGSAKGPPLKGTDFMLNSSDDEIVYAIRFGRGTVYKKYGNIDGEMPGFERLGSDEVKAIAGHIKAFGRGIPTGGRAAVEEDNSSDAEYEDKGEEGDGGD